MSQDLHTPNSLSAETSTTPRSLDRRECLTWIGAGMVASSLASSGLRLQASTTTSGSPSRATRRIDTHQHLWDLERFRLPWTDGDAKLERSFLIADYRKAAEGTGIERAVYMEVGMAREFQVAEAEWLVEFCADPTNGTVAGVIAGQPFEEGFLDYAKRFARFPAIKGIRHLLHTPEAPAGTCLKEEYRRGVAALGDLGLRFDLCVRPGELDDVEKLVAACPQVQFVLDHCGNADPLAFAPADQQNREPSHDADAWRRSLAKLAKRENVICKISGIIARVNPEAWSSADLAPIVNHCLDSFGPERVMFASDWPVCTLGASLQEWVKALDEIVAERPEVQQSQLFYDNAVRFYGLG